MSSLSDWFGENAERLALTIAILAGSTLIVMSLGLILWGLVSLGPWGVPSAILVVAAATVAWRITALVDA